MSNDIKQAKNILQGGGLVGIPTETVYGLAASIESDSGLYSIFETKERPFFDPLIVHINNIDQAKKYTLDWSPIAQVLAEAFWPGPMTLVLKKSTLVKDIITAGLDSVGLRIPNHEVTLNLIKELGHPIAAPSANKFKKTSPTNYSHVKESFPDLLVLDGGPCEVGIESTVIGVHQNKVQIYRPGIITLSEIKQIFSEQDMQVTVEVSESPVAPGQLKHHYMPKVPVILFKGNGNTQLDDLDEKITHHIGELKLDPSPTISARFLYQQLRELDKKHSAILIRLTEEQLTSEKWNGIVNRIEKAASFILPK